MPDTPLAPNVLIPVLIGVLSGIGAGAIGFIAGGWLAPFLLVGRKRPPPVRWRNLGLALAILSGFLVAVPQIYSTVFPAHHACLPVAGAGSVDWIAPVEGGQGSLESESIAQPVVACQTLMLTGRAFVGPDGRQCSGSVTQVCVLLVEVTYPQTVRVSGLEPLHTWYGVTNSNPTQSLAWQAPNFWMPSNCETGRGCDSASVYRYLDGEFIDHFELLSRP
ncbi:MAG: hypothetical protein HY263_07490 [Chloroflexi bacterium]|nr:hypothetical protein [Chloroflexota bacterium]